MSVPMLCHKYCCCCCPLGDDQRGERKYRNVPYKSPDDAKKALAIELPEIKKVPLEKVFEYQQPRASFSPHMHPQLSQSQDTAIVQQPIGLLDSASPETKLTDKSGDSLSTTSSTESYVMTELDDVTPKLQFSLYYDIQRRVLSVHLQQGVHLSTNPKHTDPFVVLFLLPNKEEIFESQIMAHTANPFFSERFEFTGLLPADVRQQTLVLRVFDHDRYTKNNLIGTVTFPLKDADLYGVTVTTKVSKKAEPMLMESRGELLLSLAYKLRSGVLHGVVLKANNLKKRNVTGRADPYIKVYLLYGRQRIAKWKSTIKKNTLIPVFNETFQFSIGTLDISTISLDIILMEYDRLSHDSVVGVVNIGMKSQAETGRLHWEEVTASTDQPISRWHTIRPTATVVDDDKIEKLPRTVQRQIKHSTQ